MDVSEHSVSSIFIGGMSRKTAYIAYEDGVDSVPKRRHIKFMRLLITQKKEYNIQNMAKV
jgi:hypothetical protein